MGSPKRTSRTPSVFRGWASPAISTTAEGAHLELCVSQHYASSKKSAMCNPAQRTTKMSAEEIVGETSEVVDGQTSERWLRLVVNGKVNFLEVGEPSFMAIA